MELVTINTILLSNQLNTYFTADWSNDGRIFIVNDTNLLILQMIPSLKNSDNAFNLIKSEIQLSDYHVANNTKIDIEDDFYNASKETFYHTVFNHNITPTISGINPLIPKPNFAIWSPISKDLINNGFKSMLAILTNAGNVEIFVENQSKCKWEMIANLTECRVNELQDNAWDLKFKSSSSNKITLTHIKRVNDALVSSFCWSHLYQKNNKYYYYVIICHLVKEITIWKIDYINSIPINYELNTPSFITSFSIENYANYLHFCSSQKSDWLIFCDIDGLVKALKIYNLNKNNLSLENVEEKSFLNIWEHKDIKVSKILDFKFEETTCLLIVKGPFILFVVLEESKKLYVKHLDFKNINITGLVQNGDNTFLVSTFTGIISQLKIEKNNKDFIFNINSVSVDLKWNYHACYGLLKSPYETLWGILIFPCKIIDHLIIRNPTQIVFTISSKYDGEKFFKSVLDASSNAIWENLEVLRCFSIKNSVLPSSYITFNNNFDNISIKELRIYMWISLFSNAISEKFVKYKNQKVNLPDPQFLKNALFFKMALNRIKMLLSLTKGKKVLNKFQQTSLQLMVDVVKNFEKDTNFNEYFGDKTRQEVKGIMEKLKKISFMKIECFWCEENLTSNPCKTQHPDQRCCISGVQIKEEAKFECKTCNAIGDENLKKQDLICPLCDLPMIETYI